MNTPLKPEQFVNSFITGAQTVPELTELLDGRIVAVWTSNGQDGDNTAVVARVFDEDGSPLGNEFIVNETRLGAQTTPRVAATADGGFVVTFQGPDDSGVGVYARQYDALGNPSGTSFLVSNVTVGSQLDGQVTGLPGGGFVIVWDEDRDLASGLIFDIRGQIYDASGVEVGAEFTVNTTGAGSSSSQTKPAIATIEPSAGANGLANGGFIVTWFTGATIYGQVFDETGATVGAEFVVDSAASTDVEVAGLSGGRFVAVWTGTDSSSNGVFAQLYEGDGTAVGTSFLVNVAESSTQYQPSVSATADGGFAVSYAAFTSGTSGDGSNYGIATRSFDANGVETAPERIVNEQTSGNQDNPAIVGLSNGNLFVAWQSVTSGTAGDGDETGIFARLLGDPASFAEQSADPELEAFSVDRSFAENTINAAPQLLDIDGAVALSDADSADFDGGRLLVSVIGRSEFEEDYQPQDADGQDRIGVDTSGTVTQSGSDVLVDGTVIGTIVSDGDAGQPLEIAFNSDATVARVETLIENLTYQNLSDDPRDQTTLGLALEDGDGGSLDVGAVTITITPEQDAEGKVRGEVQVNTVSAGAQNESAISGLTDGGYISVWVSTNQDNSGDGDTGVFAQRYDATGSPVGAEFQVNTTVNASQFEPEVTGLTDGGFVIVWRDDNGTTIRLNRYDSTGTRTITELDVVTDTTSTQSDADVQALSNGGYVVTWTNSNSSAASGGDGSSNSVKGQLYNATGAPVGGEFLVNEQTTGAQNDSAIAALDSGRFVVTWTENNVANGDGDGTSVSARIFDATGVPEAGEFQVNSTSVSTQNDPVIATLANGDFVVAWNSFSQDSTSTFGVYYQRFDSSGNAIGGEVRVNEYTPGNTNQPDIIALDTGGFVISWSENQSGLNGSSGTDVYVVSFDADGTRLDTDVLVNTEVAGTQDNAVLAALPNGNFVVQWTSVTNDTAGDGSGDGVFQQIFGDPSEITASIAPSIIGLAPVVAFAESDVNAGALVFPAGAGTIIDTDSADFDGGQLQFVRVVTEPLQEQFNAPDDETQDNLSFATGGRVTQSGSTLLVDGVSVATITSDGQNGADLRIDFLPGATLDRVEALIGSLTYQNPSDDPRETRTYSLQIEDGDGGATPPIVVEIQVSDSPEAGALEKVGPETLVNDFTAGAQTDSAVATLTDGGWVVAWESDDQDGASNGVYAQRFDANGTAVGAEFQVATTTASGQGNPSVAALTTGGWIITWDGNGAGDNGGVFYSSYGADGAPVVSEELVNTTTSNTQEQAQSVGLPGGGYAVVWNSGTGDGSVDGIFLRIYASDGSVVASEVQVNTEFSGNQSQPDIEVLSDGRLAISWTSATSGTAGDGSFDGIFGAIFNANGTSSVGEFQINTITENSQQNSKIAAVPGGGFIVVWESGAGEDGSGQSVVAQRFDNTATPIDGPFVVNELTNNTQGQPDIAVASDGSFVITWTDFTFSSDGSGDGVWAQAYDASGARLDSQQLVNTEFSGSQNLPAIAALPGGNYVVSYSSATSGTAGDGSSTGVFQQILGDPADFTLGGAPLIQGFSQTRSISEADANAGPVLLDEDGTVAIGDTGATGFDGGRLAVSVVLTNDMPEQQAGNDGADQDSFTLVQGDRGNGDVQISGTDVSVDGTIIGTLTPSAGGVFEVNFNASATVEAVEAVVSAIGYESASQAPMLDRTIRVDLTDGDGFSAPTQFIDLTVTPETDSTLVAQDERKVNAFTQNSQTNPEIAELTGGGFVVVWQSQQDNSTSTGVYAQLYDAAGRPVGPETLVNTTTASTQGDPVVAGMSDGGYLVVWEDSNGTDGSSTGIIAQRFNSSGQAQGGEVVVNTTTSNQQRDPAIDVAADGSYVITYNSDSGDGSADAILSQRFNADGTTNGTEAVVNAVNTSGNQSSPDVAYFTDGTTTQGYAVTFVSNDGDGSGVFVRVFDTAGVATGDDVRVNTTTSGTQDNAKIAGLTGGGFVVVWEDSALDGSVTGIFAQLYDAAGATVGGEFRLNTETVSSQFDVDVTATASGGFAVSFTTNNGQADGSGSAVILASFDANGQKTDQEVVANDKTSSTQDDSALVGRTNGDILVVYTSTASSAAGDGSADGIFLREFTSAPGADISPDLSDFARLITRQAGDITGGNSIFLDQAVAFSDSTSADFDGGTLELYYNFNGLATDQLAIAAGGDVTVAGSDVSVNGTLVGVIDGTQDGANGQTLLINLNANATAADVKAVLEQAIYFSSDTEANVAFQDKGIGVVITDGDGGQTEPDAVFIDVQGGGTTANTGLRLVNFGQRENGFLRFEPVLESELLSGPQRIDTDIEFNDFAGTSFASGFLELQNVTTFTNALDISLEDIGTGNGEISFDGADASYEGTVIGTLDATNDGQDGQAFRINLNASATEEAIEALAEALTISLNAPTGVLQPLMRLTVTNGTNTITTTSTLPITRDITTVELPTQMDEQVNTFTTNDQQSPRVAALSDGGYVIVWTSESQDVPGTTQTGIFGQVFSPSGDKEGIEFQVNDLAAGVQNQPRVTALDNGTFVVLWSDQNGRDGSGLGVFGQVFDNAGTAQGSAFQANEETSSTQNAAQIAELTGGGFLTVWVSTNSGTAGDGSSNGIFARVHNADGTPAAGEFQINTTTSGDQNRPRVTELPDGDILIVWEERGGSDGASTGVVAQRIDGATGGLVSFDGTTAGADEVLINTTTAGAQDRPDAAGLASSATLPNGGFVVVWSAPGSTNDDIFAQIFDIDGTPQGGEFVVSTLNDATQSDPTVVGRADGSFSVIWVDSGSDGSSQGVFGQDYNPDGTLSGPTYQVNSETSSTQYQPDAAELSNGALVVAFAAFTSGTSGDGSRFGVFQQIFDEPASPAGAGSPVTAGFEDSVTFTEADVNAGLQLLNIDGALSLTDADSTDFDGGSLFAGVIVGSQDAFDGQLGANTGAAQDDLGVIAGNGVTLNGAMVLVDGTDIGTISSDGQNGAPLQIDFNTNATPERVEQLVSQIGYGNDSDNPDGLREIALQVTDGDGGSTGSAVVSVTVTPEIDRVAVAIGDEEQVNTYTPNEQSEPATAAVYNSAGVQTGTVVVWRSINQDQPQDNSFGVYAQLFDLAGSPIGGEFRVNEETFQNERDPSVVGLQTGGFAVVWEDGSGQPDVELRIFDASGAPVTGEIQVEPGSLLAYAPDVAAKSNGNILVSYTDWSSTDGSGYGIFVQEYDNTGTLLTGAPIQINTETSGNQDFSSITVLSDDRYVVTWQSPTSGTAGDGNSTGIIGQIVNADGTLSGSEFIVNSLTIGSQDTTEVAALTDGGFVVVWTDNNTTDGSGTSVQMQRYDSAGNVVGGQLRVNETTVNSQFNAEIVGLDDGGWVVTWQDNNATDGSGTGVFAQVYDATGNRVDGQFQVNTEFSSTQNDPVVAALPNGGFSIAWTSVTSSTAGDGSGTGIFQQIFANPALVSTSADPELVGADTSLTLTEADLNAGPQAIAPSIAFGDADSADFAGGQLTVIMIDNDQLYEQFAAQDSAGQDQLSLLTSGAVSISSGDVSVDGTVIGTLDSDGAAGAPLVVSFNASATPERIEQLIEAIAYQNVSDDPSASRLISIQVTDGDGGAVRSTVDVTITPEIDGGVPVDDEVQTNSFTLDRQDESAVATLTDGGYVIVWTSNNQDGRGDNADGVFLQRYDAAGAPVGGEIQVNTTTASSQFDAHVVGLTTGGYAVAWTDNSGANSPNNDQEVTIQVFDALGAKVGTETILDTTDIRDPNSVRLAAEAGGNFTVVAAATDALSPFSGKIIGQSFTDQGGADGARFDVPVSGNSATQPDVAVQANGTFAVVYTERAVDNAPTNDFGILLQRYASDNSQIGGPVVINSFANFDQTEPRIAALEGGGYVVVWTSNYGDNGPTTFSPGVYAQILDTNGAPVGGEFLVNEVIAGSQFQPDVAALEGGGFVVAYSDSSGTDGSGQGVFVQQYSSDGTRADDPIQVNQEFSSTQGEPSIAALPGGNFVVSFTSETSSTAGDGDNAGVFHRIIGDPADFGSGGNPVLDGVNAQVTYLENDINGVPGLIDANGAAAVSDPDSADFDGGAILVSNVVASAPLIDQINPPDDLTQDVLGLRQADGITITTGDVFVGGTQVGTIVQDGQAGTPFEIALNANADTSIVELLVENLTYRNLSDDPLEERQLRIQITDGDGGASDPTLVTLNITPTPDGAVPVGGERVVETSTGGSLQPRVAELPGTGGDFIVVWTNRGADGDRDGILAQRFDVNGNPIARDGTGLPSGSTDEFVVNTTTAADQDQPDVAAFSDGSFVVVWTDNSGADGSGVGVFGQLYNADGTTNGGEFQVNALTSSSQFDPAVTVLADDNFVVSFSAITSAGSGDGSGTGVSARLFDSNGVAAANEFVVNTETSSTQDRSAITALSTGGFVVTWTSVTSGTAGDGSFDGVFAQIFSATGVPVGGEFQVNTLTNNSQNQSKVVELADGNLVFVWSDGIADLSGFGVYGQIYAPDGTVVSEQFRVNDQRTGSQFEPDVAALDTGGFVVTWSDNNGTDGSGIGVFAQQYDGAGARVDSQLQVNTTTSSTQDQPSVSGLEGGGFVVAFNNDSGTVGEILLQVYGNALPTVSPVSATGDEDTAIVLDAAIFDAGFTDPDGNTLQAIRIETFPTNGTLALNGTPVVADQEVSRADLLAGNLVYTGAQDFNGADSFLWTGSDGIGFSNDVVEADITVNPVNDAPALEAGADTTVSEGQNLNRSMVIGDPDTDTRTYTVDYGDGSPVEVFNTSSTTPALNHVFAGEGVFTVSVTVDDNAGEANSVETDSFVVTVVNANPNAANNSFFVSEDGPAQTTGNVLDNDSDPGNDPLVVSAVNGQAADVGQALTLASGAIVQINADGTFSYDPNGSFEELSSFQSDTDSVTYEVSDGDGGTDTATVTFFINGANDTPDAVDDSIAANDLAAISGDVFADNGNGPDSDIDQGDTLVVSAVNGMAGDVGNQITLPSGALLTLNADGTFDYDPNGAVSGQPTDSFTYELSDGRGGTDTATVTLNIQQSNQPPVAQDDAIAANEDTGATGNVLADNGNGIDDDPDGDPLTVTQVDGQAANVGSAVTLAGGGQVTVNGDGTFSFASNAAYENLGVGQTATESFTYTIQDGNGGSDQATVTITVDGVNDAPVVVADTGMTDEEASTAGDVLANDSDVDGDTLSVTEVGGSSLAVGQPTTGSSGGTFVVNSDGTYTYDPAGQFEFLGVGDAANDSISYRVSDANGGEAVVSLTVTITGVNDAPDAVDDALSVSEISVLNGNLLDDNSNGADTDPDLGDLPVVTEVNGSAADIGSTVTLASGALLTVNASGTFTYDPNGAFATLNGGETATESFTYTIDDQNGGTDTATATVTILGNESIPVAADDANTTDEDTAVSGAVLGNDSDGDGDTLVVSGVEGSAGNVGVQVTLASGALVTMGSDGTYDYDPNGQFEDLAVGESATDTFSYTISDGNGGTDTATVTITIDGVNDAPIAADDFLATDEDTALNENLFANNGAGADSDVDASDMLVVSAVNGQAGDVGSQITLASGALLTVGSDGSVAYDPNSQFESLGVGASTTDSFSYTISDGNGGTDTATVTIQIAGANDAPAAADDNFAVGVGAALAGDVLADNGSGPDSDPDAGDVLTVNAVEGAPGNVGTQITLASSALLTVNADGTFDYDQNGAFAGLGAGATATDSFSYTISDGNGGTDTATVTITVGGSNQPPVAGDDAFSTDEDTSFTTGSVLANDSDPNSDPLILTSLDLVGTQGLVTDNEDGTFDYDPNGQFEDLAVGESATDTFSYTISDGNGGTDTATVTITIDGVNDAPIAADDFLATDEDTALNENLFANNGAGADSDVDASDMLVVSAVNGQAGDVGSQITLASGALLTVGSDGSVAYDPNSQFESLGVGASTTDSFSYTISDGNGGTDTATVTIQIAGANDAPAAADDNFAVGVGAALAGDVLADNGSGPDSDPDAGDVLTVNAVEGAPGNVGTQITLASSALLTVNADGTFDYDQNGAFAGLGAGATATDSFSYTISDGNGGTDTATVTITVGGSNQPPVAGDDAFSTDEDTSFTTGSVLANDSDPNSDPLILTSLDLVGTQGLVTDNEDGTFDYDPNGQFEDLAVGESATDTFSYTISDGNGGTDTATVTITIDGVNDAPIAADDFLATDEDTALNENLFANNGAGADSDVDASDMLVVSAVNGQAGDVGSQITLASGALLTVGSDGSVAYDPNSQFESLGVGASTTDSFSYTISDGNGGTDTATVTIQIAGANDAPAAADDNFAVGVGAALAGDVLADNGSGPDSDPDAGDVLTVNAVEGAPGNVGTQITLASSALLTVNADGTFDYDQNGAFAGLGAGATATDSFSYTISDGNGGTDTATVTITVGGSNQPPVAGDDAFSTDEDTSFTTGSVLANDSDPNSDPLILTSLDLVGTQGLVTDNEDGTFDYDPNGQFEDLAVGESATDTFSYTISDGNGGTDTATVTITIDGVNDAPIAAAITAGFGEDATGRTVNLLDPAFVSDPDSDDLDVENVVVTTADGRVLSATTDPDTGLFSLDDGQFEDLAAGASFDVTIDYDVTDGITSTANTATVTITGANDDPLADADGGVGFSTDEDTAFTTASVLGNDTDVDGDALTVTALDTTGTLGLVTDNGDGTFGYDPNGAFETLGAGDSTTDSFSYTVSDGNGGTDTATVTVTVGGVNDDPVLIELNGTDGRDRLRGTDDDELINGLGGSDTYFGRGGADTFVFDSNGIRDREAIRDFESGVDSILIDSEFSVRFTSRYAVITTNEDQDSIFVYGDATTEADLNIRMAEDDFTF